MNLANLETSRLLLRPWTHDDAPRLLDLMSRLEVVRWLGDGGPRLMADLDEARERIDRYAARSTPAPLGVWAVEVRETGHIAGTALLVALPNPPDPDRWDVEVGWHLHPDSWGHGYATEAAAAELDHGFAHGLAEVHAVTHLGNDASQRVCARLGMTDEGVVHQWYDIDLQHYRITSDAWRTSRSAHVE